MENNELLEKIKNKYLKNKNGEESWKNENESVAKLLDEITSRISERYEITDAIGVGGTAIVLKVQDRNLNIPRALKFPRPIEGNEDFLASVVTSEISRLIESTHENIVSIYYQDSVKYVDKDFPLYIMEYIDGAVDAKEYLLGFNTSNSPDKYRLLISLLRQVVAGLEFLHSKDTLHCDIKLENILVSPTGKAKISDFGSARVLNPKRQIRQILLLHTSMLIQNFGTEKPSPVNMTQTEYTER